MVYIGGTWDLLHAGHLSILEQARALGDYLIVGIYNDSLSSMLHIKNKHRNKKRNKNKNKIKTKNENELDIEVENRNDHDINENINTNINENENENSNENESEYEEMEMETETETIDYSYPILSMQERMLSLLGCKYINDVLIDAPYVLSSDLLSSLNITIVAIDSTAQSSYKHKSNNNDKTNFENDNDGDDYEDNDGDEDCREDNREKEKEKDLNQAVLRHIKEKGDLRVLKPNFSITGQFCFFFFSSFFSFYSLFILESFSVLTKVISFCFIRSG